LFERKGLIAIKSSSANLEQVIEIALDHGAEDVTESGDLIEIVCPTDAYSGLVEILEGREILMESKEVTRIPNLTVEVDSETATSVMKLLEKLEDNDDVQSVATNVNFTAEQLAAMG
jgi:transcriptional/translational regulatory protein YebC/TACO1